MRRIFAALVIILARHANGQAPVRAQDNSVPGTWRGTSVCLVRPSSCKNEVVVYRITPANAPDSVALDARKIVNGREDDMGVLSCSVTSRGAASADVTCRMPNGVWTFHVRRDSLVGELQLPDGRKFRDVRAIRTPDE